MTSAKSFYTERIPTQFNRALDEQQRKVESADATREDRALLDGLRGLHATLRVIVAGEAGGNFYLNVDAGRMSSDPTPAHPPFLTLVQDLAAFEVLERETGDSALGFLGGLGGLAGELHLTDARVGQLQQLEGTLRFELTGEDGFSLLTHFGNGEIPAEPSATVRVSAKAYAEIQTGSLTPPEAFMNGAVELDGDIQLAMQVALALVAPE